MTLNPAGPNLVTVTVNQGVYWVDRGSSLAALVARLGHAPDAVATAIDAVFVPRGLRESRRLHGGEAITFFQPIVGG